MRAEKRFAWKGSCLTLGPARPRTRERVLVTGATGFVGSAVTRAFLRAGYGVRALLRPESDRSNLAGLDVEVTYGDVRSRGSLRDAFTGCDGLIHVASDYRLFVPDPAPLYATNVAGTRAVMDAALENRCKRVVHTSSVAVLGYRADGAAAEEIDTAALEQMVGHYKRSKHLAEATVARLVANCGLPAVIVNPSAPVGPRDARPTPTGRMVLDAACGRMPAYVDTGLNIVHVDDVGEGHRLAYERGRVGERYILGGDNLTLEDIFGAITALAGRRAPRFRISPDALVPLAWLAEGWARLTRTMPRLTRDELAMARHRMYFTSAKAERELGYSHRPAQLAFADAIAWFAAHGRIPRREIPPARPFAPRPGQPER